MFYMGLTNQGYLALEHKWLVSDILNITVWLDGENVEVNGVVEPEKQAS